MTKQPEIKLTIEGGGLSFKRSIDENTALKIMNICMGSRNNEQHSMDVAQPVSVNSGSPPKTAREYLLTYKPSNNQEKILVLAYFLKEEKATSTFQQAHFNELFREGGEKHPANLSAEFTRVLRKGWIAEEKKQARASSKKSMYFITNTGLDVLANSFATNPVPKSKRKKAVRRKKARVGQ